MQARHLLEFSRPPAVWSVYSRVMWSRKPAWVPEGGDVPRIEARLPNVPSRPRALARYRALCGGADGDTLPIAYPHVLAMPLHLAMLSAEAFPVKLFGLVHVANRIVQNGPLPANEPGDLACWIEGHRETPRGQEFDLHTRYSLAGSMRWEETCTFLARRRAPGASRAADHALKTEDPPPASAGPAALRTSSFQAAAGIGRRYGFVSGDLNPIHLSRITARAFGFSRAIAHGMWTLARVAADLPFDRYSRGCELDVRFKLPVYLPAALQLRRWDTEQGEEFLLCGAGSDRPHLSGTLRSLS